MVVNGGDGSGGQWLCWLLMEVMVVVHHWSSIFYTIKVVDGYRSLLRL